MCPQVGVITSIDFPRKLKFPVSERWVLPGWVIYDYDTGQPTAGNLYYIPIFVPETTTYDRIGLKVSADEKAALARLGLYAWDDGVPGALILDAGTVNLSTIGEKLITISQVLTRGYYFLAYILGDTVTIVSVDVDLSYQPAVPSWGIALDEIYNYIGIATGRIADVAGGLQDPAPAQDELEYDYICAFLREV